MTVLRAALCVVLGLVGLFALALLLPMVKEGFGREDLPRLLSVALALAALAGLWWWGNGPRHRTTGTIGVALLALPLLVYVAMAVQVVLASWRGRRLARTVHVVALRESPLRFAGITEPVGVRTEIELDQAIGLEGNLLAPRVVMGADPRPTADEYFTLDSGPGAVLTAPVFELMRQPPRDVVARAGRTRIVFDLLPSHVGRRDGSAVCFESTASPATATPAGPHLGASWLFAAPGGVTVDLSGPLTDALRRQSGLEGRPEAWAAIVSASRPDALARAGYRPCAPPDAGGLACLCPPVAP
jgi:hypothetical protein